MSSAVRPKGHFRNRSLVVAGALAAVMIAVPQHAHALSGLYGQLGLGYGKFSGNQLITEERPEAGDLPLLGAGCCPAGGLAPGARIGYSFFGFAGAEVGILGNVWSAGGKTGGGGFIGGGVRAFPLQFLTLGGLDLADFPLDVSLGLMFGYAIVGKEFAYTGTFFDFDLGVDFILTTFMSIGAKVDVVLPTYSDFVFTDYKNNVGRCLDVGAAQVIEGGAKNKDDLSCSGQGPSTTFVAPQLVLTVHYDLFE